METLKSGTGLRVLPEPQRLDIRAYRISRRKPRTGDMTAKGSLLFIGQIMDGAQTRSPLILVTAGYLPKWALTQDFEST